MARNNQKVNYLPPLMKDVDVENIVVKKATKSTYGTMYTFSKKDGKEVQFYFGEAFTMFGADQESDPKDPTKKTPEKKWGFSVKMGWDNLRTEQEQERVDFIRRLQHRVAQALTEVKQEYEVVDEANEPLTKEQIYDMMFDPIVSKRSKTKKQENPNKPGKFEFKPYEPAMKWVIPFDFENNQLCYTRFLNRGGFDMFRDEDDKPIEPIVDNARLAIPPRSTIQIWGRLTSIFIPDPQQKRFAYLRFDTMMNKRVGVEETHLGQLIDTSQDYADYYNAMVTQANPEPTEQSNDE